MAAGLALAAPGFLWVLDQARPSPLTHEVALFGHLACLVVGFGAVLTVDWVAALWVLRRRTLSDILTSAGNVHVPIWTGYAGLVLTGLLLEPDLSSRPTQLKLALVLLIGWNGLLATWLRGRLDRGLSPAMLTLSCACAGVSQAAWWGALAIGHLTAR